MDQELAILLLSTVSVGAVHTLVGPDHYVPFIALSRSRGWKLPKTVAITTLCAIGHILSAVILGVIAASVGGMLARLEIIESVRGNIAAWLLTAFGFAYCVWGIRSAIRNNKHSHFHDHGDGDPHAHEHAHRGGHSHVHAASNRKELTPWLLFIIFVFGPCEPLIPLIMYPAVEHSVFRTVLVTCAFGVATLATMLAVVVSSSFGLKKISRFPLFERYGNAAAGGLICSCGLAMTFLGL